MNIQIKTKLANEVNVLIKNGHKFRDAYYIVKKRYSDMPPINEIASILGKRPKKRPKKKPETALEKIKQLRKEKFDSSKSKSKITQSTLWNEENMSKDKTTQDKTPKKQKSQDKSFTVSQNTEISLNGSKYLLEKGDRIIIR